MEVLLSSVQPGLHHTWWLSNFCHHFAPPKRHGLGLHFFVHQSVNCLIIEACVELITMLATVLEVEIFAFDPRSWMRFLALFIVLSLSSQYDINQTCDMFSIPHSFSPLNSHSMRSPITCYSKSHLWQRDGMMNECWTLVCRQFSQIFPICFAF